MMIGQSVLVKEAKQETICEEHYQNNIEEEEREDPLDQLTLSQCFMNKGRPTGSPSTGTPVSLTNGSTSRKRSKQMSGGSMKKSAAHCSCVKEKAIALKASLDPGLPSFIKFLLRSHVTIGFWLGLPVDFCRMHLPNHDLKLKLVGQDGVSFEANFLAGKQGLSGGWRGFSLAHNLQEGDAAVFHLVRHSEFKIYTVRVNELDHRSHEGQLDTETEVRGEEGVRRKMKNMVELTPCVYENCLNRGEPNAICELRGEGLSVENAKEDPPAENMEGCCSPQPFVDLKSFRIVVNGSPVDPELCVSARIKYYELCCARNSYLHAQLLKSINHKLATGIILETVSIAGAIKACSLSTSQADIKEWEKGLEGFQLLGMDVGFLLDRVKKLLRLAVDYQECGETNKYHENINNEKDLNEEIASLETKLMELKEARVTLQSERETLEAHVLNHRLNFQETVKMPW